MIDCDNLDGLSVISGAFALEELYIENCDSFTTMYSYEDLLLKKLTIKNSGSIQDNFMNFQAQHPAIEFVYEPKK